MINWLSIIILIISFFFVEIVFYISILLIKALRIYIRKNNDNTSMENTKGANRKSKAKVIGVSVFNIILVALIVAMPFIQRNKAIYYTENVISCDQNDIDKFTRLLDKHKIDYKIIGSTNVKMQNKEDFEDAEKIVQDYDISYSVSNVVHR